MFLTVLPGKVYTDNGGRRYPAGAEIDVDERTGEGLIRNEVAAWSEHPKWKQLNFKLKAIKITTIKDAAAVTDSIYDTLKESGNGEKEKETVPTDTPEKVISPAPAEEVIKQPKKRMGRPPRNKE